MASWRRSSAAARSPSSHASKAATRLWSPASAARASSPSATKSPCAPPISSRASSVSPRRSSSFASSRRAVGWLGSSSSARRRSCSSPLRTSSSASDGTSPSKKRSTSAGGSAPVNSAATRPSLKAFTDGIPWMRKAAWSCGFFSTSTLASSTLPARASAARSSTGVSCLQGPHQSAQKSTTTGTSLERSSTRCSNSCSSTSNTAPFCASALTKVRPLDHHGLKRRAGTPARRVAQLADRLHHVRSLRDLAEQGVVGRQPGVRASDHEELAPRCAGRLVPRLCHRDHSRDIGRIRRNAIPGRVSGSAGAARGGIAALDHEAGDDAVEDRVVEETTARERRKRGRGAWRRPLVEPDREGATARAELDLVRLGGVERRPWRLLAAAVAWRGLLDVLAGRLLLLGRRRRLLLCGLLVVVVSARREHEPEHADQR